MRDIFAGNYIGSFQKARIARTGSISRSDYYIDKIQFKKNNGESVVLIADKQTGPGLQLSLHKKNGKWLIFMIETPK